MPAERRGNCEPFSSFGREGCQQTFGMGRGGADLCRIDGTQDLEGVLSF